MLSSSSSAQSQAAGPDSSAWHSPALLGSQGSGVVVSQTRGSVVVMLVGLTGGGSAGLMVGVRSLVGVRQCMAQGDPGQICPESAA